MTYKIPRVVIAGLRGGSGKTTLSVSLCRAFTRQGRKVTAFKKGPDYIDAGWLSKATGRECYNLDTYLIPEEVLYRSFLYHTLDAELSIIEGNRGLFDGLDAKGTYSTAELAKRLQASVVLVVDCTKVTRTIAALLKGVREFDPKLMLEGVILNNIAGRRHEMVVREAIKEYAGLKVVGVMKKLKDIELIERHMGLKPYHEHDDVEGVIDTLTEKLVNNIDLQLLYQIASKAPELSSDGAVSPYEEWAVNKTEIVDIGVIRDRAFQFYYPENLEALRKMGARLIEIDATAMNRLPAVDALYIGGGFPETNAIELSKNRGFMESLKREVEKGLPVYAECGGLMYLGKEIQFEGKGYEMTGILPLSFELFQRPVAHGYTVVEVIGDNPFYQKGTVIRGHEFHYSAVKGYNQDIKMAFKMLRGKGIQGGLDGIVYKNVFATYTHVHAFGTPEWTEGLIKAARMYRNERGSKKQI